MLGKGGEEEGALVLNPPHIVEGRSTPYLMKERFLLRRAGARSPIDDGRTRDRAALSIGGDSTSEGDCGYLC
jgi:hypothetical protein